MLLFVCVCVRSPVRIKFADMQQIQENGFYCRSDDVIYDEAFKTKG